MVQHHDFHFPKAPNETWEQFEMRLLDVVRGCGTSNLYKAVLDIVESVARREYEQLFNMKDPTEVMIQSGRAKAAWRIYAALDKLQRYGEATDDELKGFMGRSPEVSLQRDKRLRAAARNIVRGRGGAPAPQG